jgi:hypothetical protein
MADKSLRKELEDAFDADDRKQYNQSQGRANMRASRAATSIFGKGDKAGAMGETINAYGNMDDKAAIKAYDHVQNIDESMAEDAATRLKKRSDGRWAAARDALKAAKK